MRINISAKSVASSPPAPDRIVTIAPRGSYSPFSSVSTSSESTMVAIALSSPLASSLVPASSSVFAISIKTLRSASRAATSSSFCFLDFRRESWLVTRCAVSWSFQISGLAASFSKEAISAATSAGRVTARTEARTSSSPASSLERSSSAIGCFSKTFADRVGAACQV